MQVNDMWEFIELYWKDYVMIKKFITKKQFKILKEFKDTFSDNFYFLIEKPEESEYIKIMEKINRELQQWDDEIKQMYEAWQIKREHYFLYKDIIQNLKRK